MVKCNPCCGMGVRHIQYLLLASMNMLDYWIQSLNVAIYVDLNVLKMTDLHKKTTMILGFLCYTSGRFISTFIVLRLSNKYTLLSFIVAEITMGAVVVWCTDLLGIMWTNAILLLIAFLRAFHAPFMYNILAKWMPPSDYTTAFCLITIVKDTFSFFLSSLVHDTTFVNAAIAYELLTFVYLGWAALFLVFGAESPQTSFFVSKQEWNYLSKAIGPRKKIHCKAKTPWMSIFRTTMLYLFILFDFGKEASGGVITTAVTNIVKGTSITGTFLFCMQASLMVYSISLLAGSILIDKAFSKEKLETGPSRKVILTFGSCGVAITMILTAYVDSQTAKISYLFVAQLFFMIVHTIEPTILYELSPNYACVIFCVDSFMRNWMILVKRLIDPKFKEFDMTLKGKNVTTQIGWDATDGMIYRYGFLIFFTNLFFIISGNIELQSFDSYDTYDWRKESVISYP